MTKGKVRTPERAALAEAIKSYAAAEAAAASANEALETFEAERLETRTKCYAADSAHEDAVNRRRELLQSSAGNMRVVAEDCVAAGEEMPDDRVSRTKREAETAREYLVLADQGKVRLEAEGSIQQRRLATANDDLSRAILAVCKSAMPSLLEQFEQAERSYHGLKAVLSELRPAYPMIDYATWNREANPIGETEARLREACSPQRAVNIADVTSPWLAARSALRTNPDAELPRT